MNVWIVKGEWHYVGAEVLSVHSSKKLADTAADAARVNGDFNEVKVEHFKVHSDETPN